MRTWIHYARVGGMLVEAGGDILRWNHDDLAWVEECLANDRSGGRVWFADTSFWSRDGLPSASYRELSKGPFLLGLYNWTESDTTITPDLTGPIAEARTFTSLTSGETLTREQLTNYPLPTRGSALFTASL